VPSYYSLQSKLGLSNANKSSFEKRRCVLHSFTNPIDGIPGDNQKLTYKAFTVEDYGEGEDTEAFWTRIASAWPHKDGNGFNVALSALPVNGCIVLREFTEEDAKPEEEKKPRCANAKR